MARETKVSLCQHVIDKNGEYDFLFGHRGYTLAAFCYLCEVEIYKHSLKYDPEIHYAGFDPFAGLTKTIPAAQALALGIPEMVGKFCDEMAVYGK